MRPGRRIIGGLLVALAVAPVASAQEYACTVSDDPSVGPIRIHAEPRSADGFDAWPGSVLLTLKATGDDTETWVEVGTVRTTPPETPLMDGWLPAEFLECPDALDPAMRKTDNMVCRSVDESAPTMTYFDGPAGAQVADFETGTKFLVGDVSDLDGSLWVQADAYATINPVGWVLESEFDRCAVWE